MNSLLSKGRRLKMLARRSMWLVRRDGVSATIRRGVRWTKARRGPTAAAPESAAPPPSRGADAEATLTEAARRTRLLVASLPGDVPPPPAAALEVATAVAVVVPAYQGEEHLEDCLESVRSQSHSDWRCYVVDDASTDDTAEIAARFARQDERFVLLRHGRNSGLSASRNTGMLAATEPWVTFLDADDLLTPTSLERRVAAAGGDDATVVGSWCATPLVPVEATLDDAARFDRRRHEHEVHVGTANGECPFNAHAPLLRRDVLIALGGFDERLVFGAEDWDLWHRLLRHGYSIRNAPGVAGLYRQRAGSMSRRDQRGHLEVGDRLLRDARRPAVLDRELAVDTRAGAPLATLDLAATRLRRIALSAGIQAGSTADASELDPDLVSAVDGLPAAWVRSLDLPSRVRAGLERGLGLGSARDDVDAETDAGLARAAASIASRLAAAADAAPIDDDQAAGAEVADCGRVLAEPDVAVVVETAADVVALAGLLDELRAAGLDVVAIDTEAAKGDEGALDAFRARDVDSLSYNHLRLGRVRPRSILIRRPMGPVTHEIAVAADRQGIGVFEFDEPARDTRIESNASESFTEVRSLSSAADLVAGLTGSTPGSIDGLQGFAAQLVVEEGSLDPSSIAFLDELHDRHRGETVVIVGNGPSLNETDLDLLSGVATFAVNGIFYADDRLPDPVTYYVVEDTSVFRENTEEIKAYHTSHKLFPTLYRRDFTPDELTPETGFFRMNAGFYGRGTGTECHPRFSFDVRQRVYCGQSVTLMNLQLAYWMGFSRVVLIGMDFSYTIPDDVDRKGDVLTSNSDDVNHFHKDYFGKGKTWKDPKLDRVLVNYSLARDIYEADGREIVNATVGGNLDLFPRMTLADAVAPAPS